MPDQFNKIRILGACVIATSLIANSVAAAGAQALVTLRNAPVAFTATLEGADVIRADHRHRDGRRDWNDDRDDHWNGRRYDRRDDWRFDGRRHADRRHDRRHEERRYKNGHRGYRDYRPGYRRDKDGWWFPLAAFALGAIILNQQSRTPGAGRSFTPSYGSGWTHIPSGNMAAHDAWCDRQYRSYDRRTKTFQPYNGPRRYCNSPFDRL